MRILVPVTAADSARPALEEVVRRFTQDSSLEVHLLHVRPPLNWYAARFVAVKTRRRWHQAEAQKVLAPCQQVLDRFRVPHSVHVETGDWAECVARLAKRLRCERVLVGQARRASLTALADDWMLERARTRTRVPVEAIGGGPIASWERYGVPAAILGLLGLYLAE